MNLFETLFTSSASDHVDQPQQPRQHEIFPEEEYAVAYAVAVRREELAALKEMLNADQVSPTAVEGDPFLREILDDMELEGEPSLRLRTSGEELVEALRELVELWDEQVDSSIGTVWFPTGADTTFRLYRHHLEARAEAEDDQFIFPDSAEQVHTLVQRGLDVIEDDTDSKLAVVHKREIPWETPSKNE